MITRKFQAIIRLHTALFGYADTNERVVKTPAWINVRRTWLIILHHTSRVKPTSVNLTYKRLD